MVAKGRITWIAGNAWGDEISELPNDVKDEGIGMLSISFHSSNVAVFDEYFQSINAMNSIMNENPWLDEFWNKYFNCTVLQVNKKKIQCGDEIYFAEHPTYTPDQSVSLVFDGVYMFALAINQIITYQCARTSHEDMFICIEHHLPSVLRQIQFQSVDGSMVKVDNNGDRTPPRFKIYNLQYSRDKGHHLVHVANWEGSNNSLIFTGERIEWTSGRN